MTPFMYIFAEPVTDAQMEVIQSRNNARIEAFERRVLGLDKSSDTEKDSREWSDIQAKVQEVVDRDEAGEDEDAEGGNIVTESDKGTKTDEELRLRKRVTKDVEGSYVDSDIPHADLPASSMKAAAFVQEKDAVDSSVDGQVAELFQDNNNSMASISRVTSDKIDSKILESISNESEPEQEETITGLSQAQNPIPSMPSERHTNSQVTPTNPTLSSINIQVTGVSIDDALRQGPQDSSLTIDPDTGPADTQSPDRDNGSPLLAMTLTIRNKVNGKYVKRPENFTGNASWEVEYTIDELTKPGRARTLYAMSQARRKKQLEPEEPEDGVIDYYIRKMISLSDKGAAWRRRVNKERMGEGIVVLNADRTRDRAAAAAAVGDDEDQEVDLEDDEDEQGRQDDEDEEEGEDEDEEEEEEEEEEGEEEEEEEEEGEEEEEEEDEEEEEEEEEEDEEDGEEEEEEGEEEDDNNEGEEEKAKEDDVDLEKEVREEDTERSIGKTQ